MSGLLDPILSAIFGTGNGNSSKYISLFPYLSLLQDHTKQCHQHFEGFDTFFCIGASRNPLDLSHVVVVLQAIQNAARGNVTVVMVDSVIEKFLEGIEFEEDPLQDPTKRDILRHLIFNAIGVATLLYLLRTEMKDRNFNIAESLIPRQNISLDSSKRPINTFCRLLAKYCWWVKSYPD